MTSEKREMMTCDDKTQADEDNKITTAKIKYKQICKKNMFAFVLNFLLMFRL